MTPSRIEILRAPNAELPLARASLDLAGAKGAGLLRLPPDWYPKTYFVSPRDSDGNASGDDVLERLDDDVLRSVLASLTDSPGQMVYVRSSAASEGIDWRGAFESSLSEATSAGMADAIAEVWSHAAKIGHDAHVGIVLQRNLDVKMCGHLSNEHRMSRDATGWVYEVQLAAGAHVARAANWRVTASEPAGDGPLACDTITELESRLRSVARRLSESPFRHHLEWVWDGIRLWIVQADRVPPLIGKAPGDAWQPARGLPVAAHALSAWRPIDVARDRQSAWPKVAAISEFQDAGLPTALLWVLEGADIVGSLDDPAVSGRVRADLDLIASGHVVLRTDIAGGEAMLPRTDAIVDAQKALDFVTSTAASLMNRGVPATSIAFIAHRFIRARAGAWTFARPNDPFVEVDSMWGVPEGLGWLPHDSSWVNVDSLLISRSIAGKNSVFDVVEGGDWGYRDTPTEWVWRSSVTEDQLRLLATGAASLATRAGKPVLTMWFIGLLDGAESDCLPWFQQDAHEVPQAALAPPSEKVEVRTIADLQALPETLAESTASIIRLEPVADLVRSKKFVDQVIELARAHNLAVELIGSPLAHPFYLLQKAGIAVTCAVNLDQPRVEHNKLVRDQIPQMIEDRGETVVAYRVTERERSMLLRAKIVEEAIEAAQADGVAELSEELADVEEVLDELRKSAGITRDDVRRRRSAKRERRGGFQEGHVLVRTGGGPPLTAAGGPTLDGLDFEQPGFTAQVESAGRRVTLSAIPPLPGERATFETVLSGFGIRVDYSGQQIHLTPIERLAAEPAVPLWDDEDDAITPQSPL